MRCRRAPRCQRTHARSHAFCWDPGRSSAPVVVEGPRREWRKPKPMMNGLKKCTVRPVKTRERELLRSRRRKGPQPRGIRIAKGRAEPSVEACHRRRPGYGKLQRETRRSVSLRSSTTSRGTRSVRPSLKKDAAAGVDGVNMYGEGLDERLLAPAPAQRGSVPGAAGSAGRDTQAGRGARPLGMRRWIKVSRSGCGCDPDTDLRGGVSWLQLRVPTGAGGARCARPWPSG